MTGPGMRHTLGRRPDTAAAAPPAGPARLAAGAPAPAVADPGTDSRRVQYTRLVRVRVRHTFYNAGGGECRDFAVRPTGATAALLGSLGLLFKPEPDGFSVLYDVLRQAELISYLAARRDAHGAWTRMSFLLSLRNPFFVNQSDLPIDLNPALRNFYLTNREAHPRGKAVLLTPGNRATAAELVPVTAGQLVQPVTPDVEAVRVLALSGEEVLRVPRCQEVTVRQGGKDVTTVECTDRVFLNLDPFPEGLYTVQDVYAGGATADRGSWLYTSLYPMPLCFVDLLFSDPDGAGTGVYPVVLPPGGPAGAGAVVSGAGEYVLRFTRRSTWWSYYVLPQAPRGELHDLRIEHVPEPGDGTPPPPRFLGPCRVRLSGGAPAWRFLSECPLPLVQRSRLHLRLHGRTEVMNHSDVLVDRLPVPSPQQVLPIPTDVAYDQALDSLAGSPGPRCQRLLDRLRTPEACSRGQAGTGAGPPSSDFSDIYVHV